MAYGLAITTSLGFTQLDDTYSRYAIFQSGTLSTNGTTYATFSPAQPQIPLVMFRPAAYGVYSSGPLIWPTKFTFISASLSPPTINYEYRALNRRDLYAVPTSGYGLVVLGEAGPLLFESFSNYMNIDTIINYSLGSAFEVDMPTPPFGKRFIGAMSPNTHRLYQNGTYMQTWRNKFTLTSESHLSVISLMEQINLGINPGSGQNYDWTGTPVTLVSGYSL